ncbi:putative ankyrin repeat protein [Glycine max]|nr:putative ankyrin repeat protein [Glycine max]
MEDLKNMQFPSPDAASQVGLLHKEIVGKVMIYELYKAVEIGNVDNFVEVLKQQCIEITLAGDSLLHVAADLGKEEITELIAHHFPELLIRRNVRGDTPLHVAVRSKNFTSTIVKFILSHYATSKSKYDEMKDKEITRERNEHGDTPLHEAVYSGHVDLVKEIFGADMAAVHCLNKPKRSPQCAAVESGKVEILNLLLQIPFPADQPLSVSWKFSTPCSYTETK